MHGKEDYTLPKNVSEALRLEIKNHGSALQWCKERREIKVNGFSRILKKIKSDGENVKGLVHKILSDEEYEDFLKYIENELKRMEKRHEALETQLDLHSAQIYRLNQFLIPKS